MVAGGAFLVHFIAWCIASGRALRGYVVAGGAVSPLAPLLVPTYTLFYTFFIHACLTFAHVEWDRREAAAAPAPASQEPARSRERHTAFAARMRDAAPHLATDSAVGELVLFTGAAFLAGLAVAVLHGLRIKTLGAAEREPRRLRDEFAWGCCAQLLASAVVLMVLW